MAEEQERIKRQQEDEKNRLELEEFEKKMGKNWIINVLRNC